MLLYHLNASDEISWVNEEWVSFARANDGLSLLPSKVLGLPVWGFIADAETQHIYRLLHHRVRSDRVPVRLPFRCDAPDRRRFLELQIIPGPEQDLIYQVSTDREEHRQPVPLLDNRRLRSEEFVTICSWCKRVAEPSGRWLEIEDAIAALSLFDEARPPNLTHGVCEDCSRRLKGALRDRASAEASGHPSAP